MQFRTTVVVVCSLMFLSSPQLVSAKPDHFEPTQIRNFTRSVMLPTGQQASINILGMQQHTEGIEQVFGAALSDLAAIANLFVLTDTTSDIAKLNAEAGQHEVAVHPATIELLQMAKKVEKVTNGNFDVVVGDGNLQQVTINKGKRSVQFTQPGVKLDIAPVLDGFLADRLMAAIYNSNIDNAMVEVGNASRSIGADVVGPWRKTITDVAGRYAGQGMAITFSNASTATVMPRGRGQSGAAAGVKSTGGNIQSATVIAKDAAVAEALANAIYDLGPEAGMNLANRVPGVRAVVRDGSGRLHRTKGL